VNSKLGIATKQFASSIQSQLILFQFSSEHYIFLGIHYLVK